MFSIPLTRIPSRVDTIFPNSRQSDLRFTAETAELAIAPIKKATGATIGSVFASSRRASPVTLLRAMTGFVEEGLPAALLAATVAKPVAAAPATTPAAAPTAAYSPMTDASAVVVPSDELAVFDEPFADVVVSPLRM